MTEQDIRLNILNTLLTTPHRDLKAIYPIHQEMVKKDPLFYVRLAAWYDSKGEIRDHKEMFIINLCLSDFEGHRDVGLAMLRELPPYQLQRVVDFIHGRKDKKKVVVKAGKKVKEVRTVVEDFGLFKPVPRSVKTEVTRYLAEREANDDWFDSVVIQAKKSLKRLYSILKIPHSDRVQKILFEDAPPEGSKAFAIKNLAKAESPAEQAKIIIENRIAYRVASTIVSAMTPTVLMALIEVMSPQELINNLNSLKQKGAFENADLKKLIEEKLEKAKTSKRVASLKATKAGEVAGMSADIQKTLEEVADTQIKSKGRIKRSTAVLVDKSGSMAQAIELGKRICAMLSAIMDAPLYVYTFDTMPYAIESKGTDLASWEKAMAGIVGQGGTSCGCSFVAMLANKQLVEQVIMITDENEYNSPPFLTSYRNYCNGLGVTPNIVFVKCGNPSTKLEEICSRNDIEYDAYTFNGDYYSLPGLISLLTKSGRLELLLEIMQTKLPQRRSA